MNEVTAAQAASLTGLSERTIRRRIAAGDLRARRVATNRYAIEVSDLPTRPASNDLMNRVEVLEQRMHLVEQLASRFLAMAPEQPTMPTPATRSTDSLAELQSLLRRVAQEAERLAPLLAPLARDTDQPMLLNEENDTLSDDQSQVS